MTLLVAMVLSISVLFGPGAFIAHAANNNDWVDVADWNVTTVEITNGGFDKYSGSLPAAPDNWQGVSMTPSAPSTEVLKAGVIELTNTSFAENRDNYGLDQYFDQNSYPQTALTNKNALLINTNGLNTAYGYSSDSITVYPNAYYKLQTWIKTSDFADGSGASIAINGLADKLSYINIDSNKNPSTPPPQGSNDTFGWQRYEVYFQTGTADSITLTFSIGNGSSTADEEGGTSSGKGNPAKGYAMFADATLQNMSPLYYSKQIDIEKMANKDSDFVNKKDSGIEILGNINKKFVYDPSYKTLITDGNNQDQNLDRLSGAYIAPLLSGDSINLDKDSGWTTKGARMTTLNASVGNSNNDYGLTQNYKSPNYDTDPNVLLMSTFNPTATFEGKFDTRALSIKLQSDLTILRHEFYRLDVWYMTSNVSGGAGAYIKIDGQSNIQSDKFELKNYTKNLETRGSEETTANAYGWRLQSIYIKGSAYNDRNINVTLGLGDVDEGLASGNAMWATPTMHRITADEYNNNVGDDGFITFDNEGTTGLITDGNFNYGSQKNKDKFEYPLNPNSWQYTTAASSGNSGWSNNSVNIKDVYNGIVPTTAVSGTDPWVELNKRGIFKPSNYNNGRLPDNLMLISSSTDTAIGYRSQPFKLDTGLESAVSVTLLADTQGYGANLVLKNGNEVVSTIEKIDTNGKFKTFTFFIQNKDADLEDLSIEIWLGLGDKIANQSKLASGYIFVDNAKSVDFSEGVASQNLVGISDFDTLLKQYNDTLYNTNFSKDNLDYNLYTVKQSTFTSYDRYDTNNVRAIQNYKMTSMGGNATVNDNNSSWGVFDITTALGNSRTGAPGIVPTDWVYNENGSDVNQYIHDKTKPNYVHQIKDEDSNLINADSPYILMMRNSSPTASRLSSDIKFKTELNSYYKATIRLKADLNLNDADGNPDQNKKGLGIELNGTNFKFENIRETRNKASEGDSNWAWYKGAYQDYTFYIKTGENNPDLSIDVTLGGTKNSKEYVSGSVYIYDINFETMDSTAFNTAINQDLDYEDGFEARLENRIYADIDKGELGAPEVTNPDDSIGKINWALAPSVIFAIFLILILFIIFINGFSKKAEPQSLGAAKKAQPKKPSYDRNFAMQKAAGVAIVDTVDTYELFDDDNLFNHTEVHTAIDAENVELVEMEIEEVIYEEVPNEEAFVSPTHTETSKTETTTETASTETSTNDSTEKTLEQAIAEMQARADAQAKLESDDDYIDDDQIAIIEQLDEDYTPYIVSTTKTVKRTVKRTVLVAKKVKKENEFKDGFED